MTEENLQFIARHLELAQEELRAACFVWQEGFADEPEAERIRDIVEDLAIVQEGVEDRLESGKLEVVTSATSK